MNLESYISGTRGFNELKSPAFDLPVPLGGAYELAPESQKALTVGGKRTIVIRNPLGGCQCLQAVIYKPSFGGQFVYEAGAKDNNRLNYSPDGTWVSFEIDATSFQPGAGQLTLLTYSGEQTNSNLNLYPLPPNVTNVRMARGDSQAIITGERLEQLQYVRINGKRATVAGNSVQRPAVSSTNIYQQSQQNQQNYQVQANYPVQNQGQTNYQSMTPPGYQPNPVTNQSSINYPPVQANQNQPLNSPVGGRLIAPNQSPGTMPIQQGPPALVRRSEGGGGNTPNANGMPGMSAPGNASSSQTQTSAPVPYSTPVGYPPVVPPAPVNNSSVTAVALAPNERLAVFDDPNQRLAEAQMTIELGLEDDRTFPVAQSFPSLASRPAIVTDNNSREIEAQIEDGGIKPQNQGVLQAYLGKVLPVETGKLTFALRNALTDYDFKVENITVETRIETGRAGQNATGGSSGSSGSYNANSFGGGYNSGDYNPNGSFPGTSIAENLHVSVDVLDWKNLRVRLEIEEPLRKMLGGRRIQFRLRDRERGDSDWYIIRQTFVRVPHVEAVVCTTEMNDQCEMTGSNLDYLGQVSIDGGATWFPDNNGTFPIAPSTTGANSAKKFLIPLYSNKKLLAVRYRDYPVLDLPADPDYKFTYNVKVAKKLHSGKTPETSAKSPVNQQTMTIPQTANSPAPIVSRPYSSQGNTSPPTASQTPSKLQNKQNKRIVRP